MVWKRTPKKSRLWKPIFLWLYHFLSCFTLRRRMNRNLKQSRLWMPNFLLLAPYPFLLLLEKEDEQEPQTKSSLNAYLSLIGTISFTASLIEWGWTGTSSKVDWKSIILLLASLHFLRLLCSRRRISTRTTSKEISVTKFFFLLGTIDGSAISIRIKSTMSLFNPPSSCWQLLLTDAQCSIVGLDTYIMLVSVC
jgi:hypothetical protein